MNFNDDDEENEKAKVPKQKKNKKLSKKKERKMEKADFKNDKDYELFLRDLEEDPELRANVNLYKVSTTKFLFFLIFDFKYRMMTSLLNLKPKWEACL